MGKMYSAAIIVVLFGAATAIVGVFLRALYGIGPSIFFDPIVAGIIFVVIGVIAARFLRMHFYPSRELEWEPYCVIEDPSSVRWEDPISASSIAEAVKPFIPICDGRDGRPTYSCAMDFMRYVSANKYAAPLFLSFVRSPEYRAWVRRNEPNFPL